MANTPVAASVKDIRAAFPQMKDSFVLKCIEREMPLASVASAAAEELQKENEALSQENEELKQQLSAMEDEQEQAKSKAQEEEEEQAKAEEEEKEAKAKARGNAPLAVRTGAQPSAIDRWNKAVSDEVGRGKSRIKAVQAANRKNPGLRQEMLTEANA